MTAQSSWSFRAIAATHHRTVQNRIELLRVNAGLDHDVPKRGAYLMDAHGFVGSRNKERRGKMLEKFQAAGGVLLDPVQDNDLQIFAAWERRG